MKIVYAAVAIAVISAGMLVYQAQSADEGAMKPDTMTGKVAEKAKEMVSEMTPEMLKKHMRSMNKMMPKRLGEADAAFDQRFLDFMILNQEGAVIMAKEAMQKGQHPEVKEMAKKFADEQQKKIDEMRKMRTQWYGEDKSAEMNETPAPTTKPQGNMTGNEAKKY